MTGRFFKTYIVDALSYMAMGLFCSLILGLIVKQISLIPGLDFLYDIASLLQSAPVVGASIGLAIALGLKRANLVTISAVAVGALGYQFGGPVGAYLASIVGVEAGSLVSKRTPVDIIITPLVAVVAGGLFAKYWRGIISPIVSACVVTAIGFSLLSVGANSFAGGVGAADFGSAQNWILGTVTLVACILFNVFAKGHLKQLSVLFGLIVGYIVALFMGKVDLSSLEGIALISLPQIMPYKPDMILLPKSGSAADVLAADEYMTELEEKLGFEPNTVGLMPLIETAMGVENAFAIASASAFGIPS